MSVGAVEIQGLQMPNAELLETNVDSTEYRKKVEAALQEDTVVDRIKNDDKDKLEPKNYVIKLVSGKIRRSELSIIRGLIISEEKTDDSMAAMYMYMKGTMNFIGYADGEKANAVMSYLCGRLFRSEDIVVYKDVKSSADGNIHGGEAIRVTDLEDNLLRLDLN